MCEAIRQFTVENLPSRITDREHFKRVSVGFAFIDIISDKDPEDGRQTFRVSWYDPNGHLISRGYRLHLKGYIKRAKALGWTVVVNKQRK